MIVCKNYTIVSGVGRDEDELVAFDKALKSAGLHRFNLVPVSSVFPTLAEYHPPRDLKELDRGAIIHVVLSKINVKKEFVDISAGICLAISKISGGGIISEYSGEVNKEKCKSILRERANKIAETHDLFDMTMEFEIMSAKSNPVTYTCCIAAVVLW